MLYLLMAIIATILGFLFAASAASDDGAGCRPDQEKFLVRIGIATRMAILYLIINSTLWFIPTVSPSESIRMNSDQLSEYGISSNLEYPVTDLRSSSIVEHRSAIDIIFPITISTTVDSVRIESTGKTMDIPLSNVSFAIIDYSEEESLVFEIDSGTEYVVTEACDKREFKVRWGWWTNQCTALHYELPDIKVVIRVHEDTYNRIRRESGEDSPSST